MVIPFTRWGQMRCNAFNGSLTAALHRIIVPLTTGAHDEGNETGRNYPFALMAVSGIGGVMLAGYSFIVRGGVG